METIRLRRKRNPNIVCEESVGTCVRARSMVPPDAVQVTSLSGLTIPLRRLVHLNALAECAVWRAWSHGGAIYFVTGTTNFELSHFNCAIARAAAAISSAVGSSHASTGGATSSSIPIARR